MPITPFEKNALLNIISNGRHHEHLKHKIGWHNYTHSENKPDAIVISVKSVEGLQQLMRTIHELNAGKTNTTRITVRVAAGGRKVNGDREHSQSYSFSPVVPADIILELTGKAFSRVERVDPDSNRVIVGGSVQVGELDRILYADMNLTTPTSSLIPYVTVAGLSATGGHGTGRDQPSFAGLVRAITFCLPNGELATIDENHHDFEIIRAAHFGLFGIVVSMELECIPAAKMQCVKEVRSVPDFLDMISDGLFEKNEYVSVMYMPTYSKNELTDRDAKNVVIMRFQPVPLSADNVNYHPLWNQLTQELSINLSEAFDVAELLRADHQLIPPYMRYLVSQSQIGEKDSLSIGPWHDIVHYQTDFPKDLDEFCGIFPVADAPHKKGAAHPEIHRAFTHLVTTLQNQAAKHDEYPITFAVYLRYLSGTQGGLSFTQHPEGHHVCAMDMTTNKNIPGWQRFKNMMADYFVNEMNAKCHWGKNILDNVNYKTMYDESYMQFFKALNRWYYKHNLVLQRSPFVTTPINDALQLPCPLEVKRSSVEVPQKTAENTVSQRKKTIAVLNAVDKTTPEGKAFRSQLHQLLDQESSSSSQALYYKVSLSSSDESDAPAKNREKKRHRCTIL